jgi:hypothetical protein
MAWKVNLTDDVSVDFDDLPPEFFADIAEQDATANWYGVYLAPGGDQRLYRVIAACAAHAGSNRHGTEDDAETTALDMLDRRRRTMPMMDGFLGCQANRRLDQFHYARRYGWDYVCVGRQPVGWLLNCSGPTGHSGMTTKIDVSELKNLGKALHRAAPLVEREFNKGMKSYGDLVAADAKTKANFSSRIPGTIKARRRGRSVSVVAGGSNAPHAPAFEHGGQGGSFRHPVYGNFDAWVEQPAHPYLHPAAEENLSKGLVIILHEVDSAIVRSGI